METAASKRKSITSPSAPRPFKRAKSDLVASSLVLLARNGSDVTQGSSSSQESLSSPTVPHRLRSSSKISTSALLETGSSEPLLSVASSTSPAALLKSALKKSFELILVFI